MPNKSPPPDEELERRSPSKDRDNETWAVGSGPEHGENAEPGLRPEDFTEEEERRPPLPATEGEPSPGIDRTAPGELETAAPLVDPEATARCESSQGAVDLVIVHSSQDPLHVSGLPTVLPHPPLTRPPRGRIAQANESEYHIQVQLCPREPPLHVATLPTRSRYRRTSAADRRVEREEVPILCNDIPIYPLLLHPHPGKTHG